MNQNLWITPGRITSCKHKTEFFKELLNNNNAILVSHYIDYSKLLSVFMRKAKEKKNEHNKLILTQ